MSDNAQSRWHHEHEIQTEHLRRQLAALATLAPARRRKFQLLVVRCQGCGDVMAEVLDTKPYPVIRSRQLVVRELGEAARNGDWARHFAETKESIRRDQEWRFVPIPQPLPSERAARNALIPVACSCRSTDLTEQFMFEQLRLGVRKVVLPK